MKKKIGVLLLVVAVAASLGIVPAAYVGANAALPTVNWLPPISNQGEFQLKDGSTLPIKFTLVDSGGSFVRDEGLRISINKKLFSDDFETETIGDPPSNWENLTGSGTVVDNNGNQVYQHVGGSYVGAVTGIAGHADWEDYIFEIDVKKLSGTYFNLIFRYEDNANYYMLEGGSSGGVQIKLYKKVANSFSLIEAVNQSTVNNVLYQYKIRVHDNSIKVWVNGALKLDRTDESHSAGRIGVGGYSSTAQFDNVMVTASPAAEEFSYGTGSDNVRISYDTVFSDDFQDGDCNGWSPVAGDTTWSVVDNKLYTNGSLAQARILADSTISYRDYSFEADARLISGRGYALNFRAADSEQFYAFQYQAGTGALSLRLYQFTDFPNGADVAPLVPYSTDNNWHHLKVVVIGNHIECYVDGDMVFNVSDTVAPAPLQGGVGFRTWSNSQAEFDNVVVQTPHYIANLHTKQNGLETGEYLITVWSGAGDQLGTYLFDLTDAIQGKGRGKGKA